MPTNPSDALRVVVGLVEKATPGVWVDGGENDPAAVLSPGHWYQVAQANDALDECEANASLIAAAVNFIREHGAALAQALENDARWRSFRRTISINADDMTPERWDKREDSFMADYADAYALAAMAAQQKEAANGD